MATGITNDTFYENAYVTVAEYKNAPTSVDFDNLVNGGNAAAQDAELANVIMRASSYMDEYFNQSLIAMQNTETRRTRITGDGSLIVHPKNVPVMALTNFQYGTTPNNLVTLSDCSQAWFEEQEIIVPLGSMSLNFSSQGPLSFGFPASNRQQMYVKYSYVGGFVNTLTGTLTAGASTMTVADTTGIVPNQDLTIYDGASSEMVVVASNYTYGNATIPLVTPLKYSHSAVAISALPDAIKQACILLTSAFIKVRGDASLTMALTTRASGVNAGTNMFGNEIKLALDMVDKYRRIR